MINVFPFKRIISYGCTAALMLVLLACSQDSQDRTTQTKADRQDDVIARVGDQAIHFNELNTMLNSSAVVGLSIPAVGTPQRDNVRFTLLDKMISANLLYLDAKRKGVDQAPEYRIAMDRFKNSMLADAYIRDYMKRNAVVTDQDLDAYLKKTIKPDTDITDEIRLVMKAELVKTRLAQERARLYKDLHESTDVTVYSDNLFVDDDAERADDTPVAKYGDSTITWGEVKDHMLAVGKAAVKKDPTAMESDARLAYLQNEIDTRQLAQKAIEQGLDQDASYLARYNEYQKTRLINVYRARLAKQMEPDAAELKAYFEANRNSITMPEYRKVQMVMMDSEDEAKMIMQQVKDGEITMYQAARDHSVAPDAKQNLGEIGWVARGQLKPELNELVFGMEPDSVGGPVKAGGLWHVVVVQDVRDAENTDLNDAQTHKMTRRKYIHSKLNDYVVNLRKNVFDVQVYENTIIHYAQQEADMVKAMDEKAALKGSVTKKRLDELEKFINTKGSDGLSGT